MTGLTPEDMNRLLSKLEPVVEELESKEEEKTELKPLREVREELKRRGIIQ